MPTIPATPPQEHDAPDFLAWLAVDLAELVIDDPLAELAGAVLALAAIGLALRHPDRVRAILEQARQ